MLAIVASTGGALLYVLREPCRTWLFGKEMEQAKERQRTVERHTEEIASLGKRTSAVEDAIATLPGTLHTLRDVASSLREIKGDIKGIREDHAETRDQIGATKERLARIEGALGARPADRRKANRRVEVDRRRPQDAQPVEGTEPEGGDDA